MDAEERFKQDPALMFNFSLRRKKKKPGQPRDAGWRRNWPFIERLESRLLLATITWSNPVGGSWHVAGNWDLGRVPSAGDNVVIPDLPGTPSISFISGSSTIQRLTSAELVNLSGGSLSVLTTIDSTAGIQLSGATLSNGTISSTTATTITAGTLLGVVVNGPVVASGGKLDQVTINGNVSVGQSVNTTLEAWNGLILNGTLTLGSSTTRGTLLMHGNQTLGGTAVIEMPGGVSTTGVVVTDPNSVLQIGPGITVRGRGGVGFVSTASIDNSVSFVNYGTIEANSAGGTITLDGRNWASPGILKANSGGTIRALGTNDNTVCSSRKSLRSLALKVLEE